MDNRRRATRLRTLKGAKAVFNDSTSLVDCVVRDLSDTGAKLKVENAVGFPDQFVLVFEDGTRRSCNLAWRTLKEIGVIFK